MFSLFFRLQIANPEIRHTSLKQELTVLVLFAVPWLCHVLCGALVTAVQLLPQRPVGNWLFSFSEASRYMYSLEPIVTIILVREIRETLKDKLFSTTNNVSPISITTSF